MVKNESRITGQIHFGIEAADVLIILFKGFTLGKEQPAPGNCMECTNQFYGSNIS